MKIHHREITCPNSLFSPPTHIIAEMTDVLDNLTYDGGLIPVIVQDIATKTVLMFAYANKEAVMLT